MWNFLKKNRGGRIGIKYGETFAYVHFEWWLVAVCYVILGILLNVGLLRFGKKYSSNSSVPWDSNLFYFLWSILSSCHFTVDSQMFGFSPSHKRPNYCGKTVCFTKKKKNKGTAFLFIYLELCVYICWAQLLVPQWWIAYNRWWPTTFGSWSHLDEDTLGTCQKLAAGQAHLAGWCARFREPTRLGPSRV